MTRFDRAAPGEGMIIYSRIENGKAYLEFQFFLKTRDGVSDYLTDIRVYDMSGRLALEMRYPLHEEELAKGMILHPHLWKGVSDPYLYSVTVILVDKEDIEIPLDRLERQLPLRKLEEIPKKGWFLNGEQFLARTVKYELTGRFESWKASQDSEAKEGQLLRSDCEEGNVRAYRQEHIRRDLRSLKEMGANVVCLDWSEHDEEFTVLCDEIGLLVWYGEMQKAIPRLKELLVEQGVFSDLYYYYKGCWTGEPFVYIVGNSLKRQKNGNFALTVYSNQKRIALYVEGVLFEFQAGPPEFVFEEIPAKKYPLQLTAEAGECRTSLTAYFS